MLQPHKEKEFCDVAPKGLSKLFSKISFHVKRCQHPMKMASVAMLQRMLIHLQEVTMAINWKWGPRQE
jgi:hypothetical protein